MFDENFSKVIGTIYDSAENDGWDEAVQRAARFVGADLIHLLLGPPSQPLIDAAPDADPEIGVSYRTCYVHQDLRTHRLEYTRKGTLLPERDLLSEREFRSSAVHQELFPRHDIHDLHFALLDVQAQQGWIGFSVSARKGRFETENLARMQALVPHFERALHMSERIRKLRSDRDLMQSVFDDNKRARILISEADGSCLLNARAQVLCRLGLFRVSASGFKIDDRRASEWLDTFINQGDLGDRTECLIEEPNGRDFIVRAVKTQTRIAGRSVRFQTVTALTIEETRQQSSLFREDLRAFAVCYRLSPAEQELVWFVLNLKTLRQYAADRGIQIDTARKQLKNVFVKLKINSQKELFRRFEQFQS